MRGLTLEDTNACLWYHGRCLVRTILHFLPTKLVNCNSVRMRGEGVIVWTDDFNAHIHAPYGEADAFGLVIPIT
jgi:hypothetical protein